MKNKKVVKVDLRRVCKQEGCWEKGVLVMPSTFLAPVCSTCGRGLYHVSKAPTKRQIAYYRNSLMKEL